MSGRLTLASSLALTVACGGGGGHPARQNAPQPVAAAEPSTPIVVAVPPPEPEAPPAEAPEAPPVLSFDGSSDWSMFHGDAGRQGVSSAPAVQAPKLRWKTRVGIQGFVNSPLVIGKVVLVPSSGTTHNSPDPEDGLYALDLSTGKRAWFAHLDGDANGAAADKKRAYVGSDDGTFHAIDLESGAVAWKQPTKGKAYGHPVLAGSLVVTGDATGYVRAFDRATGAPKWAVQLSGAIRGGASADERRVYAVSQAGELAAFELDGRVVYRRIIERPPWDNRGKDVPVEAYSPPIIAGDRLILPFARDTYYSSIPALLAVDKKTGKVVWRARGTDEWGNVRSTPVLVGDLLVYAEPYSGDVAGISATNGRVVYRKRVGACYFPQWSSPAAAGELVYVMRFDGVLHAVRATDGKRAWRFYLGDSARTGTQVPSEIESAQGCEWDVPIGHPAYSPVAVAADGTVLVGTHEGFLYALGPA